jgi:transposase InsO family protein
VARALDLPRSGLRSAPVFRDEEVALARRIEELAGAHPRYGYRRIRALLVREGWSVNQKAVRRLDRDPGLKVARPRADPKPRREHGQDKNAGHLRPSRGKDDVWTWDFIFDRTGDGRSLKWLSIVDEYTRGCLALAARRGMTAEENRLILAEVAARRGGPPRRMRSDNGPGFAAVVVRTWLEETGSGAPYIAPGSPWQNGYAESFHSKLRDEFLNLEEFENEPQAGCSRVPVGAGQGGRQPFPAARGCDAAGTNSAGSGRKVRAIASSIASGAERTASPSRERIERRGMHWSADNRT